MHAPLARRLALALLCVAVPIGLAEAASRVTKPPPRPPLNVFCQRRGCPELFELAPRPDVSPQGLRDRVFAPAPEPGTLRVLVLGDSLPYGPNVPADESFPKVLERALGAGGARAEVINGGVSAYSPWNERQRYEHKLRTFQPDVVVVSICLNDVADPVLHWAAHVTGGFGKVPDEAIPNQERHHAHTLPLLARRAEEAHRPLARVLHHSEFYRRFVAPALSPGMPKTSVRAAGRTWPAFLVGEDDLSIEVLADEQSPEWTWLRRELDALVADVRADGAGVALLINPLSYQLDPDYPVLPQRAFEHYCAARGLPCLDVLPALREHRSEQMFLGAVNGGVDVWHYAPAGHRVVGEALATYLTREKLTTPRARPVSP